MGNNWVWADRIVDLGPDYGYYPNASKTWLIVKEENLKEATTLFEGTGVAITTEGRRHLGATIGTHDFVERYIQQKVSAWIHEVDRLSSIAITQPHAAYAAFSHGLSSKWTYLARTIPDCEDLFKPLEEAIRQRLLPSLTGQNAFNDTDRDIALPARLGGLGITDPSRQTSPQHIASVKITAPLVTLILEQPHSYPTEAKAEQTEEKKKARTSRRRRDLFAANELEDKLPSNLRRAMTASKEKGASSWLSILPIAEHGFALHKGAFRDALCLRYGWRPPHLPSHCVCGKQLTVEHALLPRRIPIYQTQRNPRRHGWPPQWSMPQCWYRAMSSTSNRGAAETQNCQQRRWSPSGYRGWKLLGERQATHIFWRKGFQSLRAEPPQYSTNPMLPPQWDGKEKNIRRTDQRDRTRVILTTSVLNIWRHGHHSNHGIQKTRLTDRWKAGQAIQQDGTLATMQTELFTAKIRNHVHLGISLCSPPSSQMCVGGLDRNVYVT